MEKLRKLEQKEIYHYLGFYADTQVLDSTTEKLVEVAAQTVLEQMQPRYICSPLLPLSREHDTLFAASFLLEGEDIRHHLEQCHSAVFLAVTLGTPLDALIRKTEAVDMARAVVLDAAANVAIEAIVQQVETELRLSFQKNQQYLTGRYSPGYGDFPLAVQKELLRITDAPRKIGLTVTASNMMVPRKSITAVLGVADIPVKGHLSGCKACAMKAKCLRRKKGTTCVISDKQE